MMELLAIEWLKIKRYRTFWVLIGFFVLLLPVWNYAVNAGFMKIGVANNGLTGFPGDLSHLFYIFLLSLNYYAFALLLSFFLKRSGITIGIFFLYCMIMESLIQKIVNMKFDTNIADYLPLQSSDE